MVHSIFLKAVLLILFANVSIIYAQKGEELNKPVPQAAWQTFKRANALAERENFAQSLVELKKVIATAPHFLQAHIKYINVKAYFLGQYNETKSEYEALSVKNPSNPIYPAALAVSLFTESQSVRNKWFESVMRLAPDWAWGQYAKAQLLQDKEPEKAIAEYSEMIKKVPYAPYPYNQAIFLQNVKLKKIDDALLTAEKMSNQPDLRVFGLSNLWSLRLAKAGTTEKAKEDLRQELSRLSASSNDISRLIAVREAYNDLLKDKEAANAIEQKIRRIDPTWYPERGLIRILMSFDEGGPQRVVYAGRQFSILNKLQAIDIYLETQEQMSLLEQLLSLNPNAVLKQRIYSRLLDLSQKSGNDAGVVKYGEELLVLNPKDSSTLAILAASLANQKKTLEKALVFALRAEELTKEFRPLKNTPDSEQEQVERYKELRSSVLYSYGTVLFKSGKLAEAEIKLRESVALARSGEKLSQLSEILRALNRAEEAERIALEAKNEYTAGIKRKFKSEPAKDFELSTIDGRRVKLSDLKGKVVMVNFWATWCKPCLKEMPHFVKAYDTYKKQGFEILAVTVDEVENRPNIVSYAAASKINFPILYDEGVARLYGVDSYPTTFFINKKGNIRYQNSKLDIKNVDRELEIVIEELLKEN
ncbi:MAG TPA: redoxin domain-containing protein [Pyrinomonadaceae bacterium]